jgi:hypothetical protein
MAEFLAGTSMVITWTTPTGTTAMAGDYRTCSWNPSIAYVDVSAGADTQIGRLPALKDATAAVTLVAQTAGTTMTTQTAPGLLGTLVIQPEGTAAGKRKITFPSYCDGGKVEWPYADVAVISVSWTGAGAVLAAFTDATN